MSLAVLADHMASKGRGGDSMLIHMAPSEIKGLQALAVANGSSLTINPETGLPEALSLKKLLPAIIGFGLNYFAPGLGTAVGEMLGTSAAVGTGVAVGSVEALRTGDLGRGISAGLGAYGGAGLSEGLMSAGSTEAGLSSGALNAQLAQAQGLPEGLSSGDAFNKFLTSDANPAVSEALKNATPFERMSAGLDAAKAAPGTFLKDNFKYLGAAAAPVLADQAVKSNMPTTTTKPGMIRPYSYDPYGGGFTAYPSYETAPTKPAANGGLMGMDNGGYNPGELNFAGGGDPVIRMADGGSAGAAYAAANNIDMNQNINNWIAANPNADRATIDATMSKYGISQDDVNRALSGSTVTSAAVDYGLSHGMGLSDINKNIANYTNAAATKNATDAQVDAAMSQYGISNEDVARALKATGGSQGEQYALLAGNMGLSGLNTNINNWLAANPKAGLADAQAAITSSGINEADVIRATGKTLAELYPTKPTALTCGEGMEPNAAGTACVPKKKTTLTCEDGFEPNAAGTACVPKKKTTLTCGIGQKPSADGTYCVSICESGYHWDPATNSCVLNISAVQPTTTTVTTPTSLVTTPATTLPVGVSGNTGASIFGGGSTVNPNGTITTSPVIPGIPVGGFTGMEQVRDAYTTGGGSLGYVPYAPKTLAEFKTKYEDKLTGGSKAAYDYLTGKAPYSPTPVTPTGQIFKPYSEAMGIPQDLTKRRYIFDPVTKTYKLNPDFKPPSYATAGTAAGSTAADKAAAEAAKTGAVSDKSISVLDAQGNTEQATLRSDGFYYTSGGNKFNEKGAQVAANGGLMAEGGLAALTMARGGISNPFFSKSTGKFTSRAPQVYADGGMAEQFNLGGYSDGGRLLRGPGDGVSDSIPATIGNKRPARLADGEFVVPARIVSELGNGSTEAGARKLYAMMDRVQSARRGSIGKGKVAKNSRADKYLPA